MTVEVRTILKPFLFILAVSCASTAFADSKSETAAVAALLDRECNHLNKDRLLNMLQSRFTRELEKGLDPNLLKIMEGVIKRTDFDAISEEKTVEIVGLVYESYKKGAPLEYLDQIFDVAYEKTISVENMTAAAKALREFHHSDVPPEIAEEFVNNSLEDGWDPAAVPVLTRGLIYGVDRGLTPRRVALIMMLDVEQGRLKKAGAEQLVLDAIKLVREKEPQNWKPLRQSEQAFADKQEQKRRLELLHRQAEEKQRQMEAEKKKAEEELMRLRADEKNRGSRMEQERLARQLDETLKASREELSRYRTQQREVDAGLARCREELEREKEKRDREREAERERRLAETGKSVAASGKSGRLDVLKLYAAVDRHMGIPYRWGGDSEQGIDCSAFVRRVYRSNEVELPRTSREQSFVGLGVGFQIMRPGDLVFFDTSITGAISHVGVYLGSGVFAHASSSKGVTKSNIHQKYYAKRFVKANRIFEL